MDRSRWRKQIGMIDDHDECEWVNVSSGTGSPGFSRTKSTEPENGCVCVCVIKCFNIVAVFKHGHIVQQIQKVM